MAKTKKGKCNAQTISEFQKGETILRISINSKRVGVLTQGRAHIVYIDDKGHTNIIEYLVQGDSFGGYLMTLTNEQEYIVVADTDCTAMFINYDHVLNHCNNNCQNHEEMIKELLLLTASKVQSLSIHVNVLSQRTLRQKLLTYLSYQSKFTDKDGNIQIPMSLTSLADYLGVDRAAMMREIHNMREEGIIWSKGRAFSLLQSE